MEEISSIIESIFFVVIFSFFIYPTYIVIKENIFNNCNKQTKISKIVEFILILVVGMILYITIFSLNSN